MSTEDAAAKAEARENWDEEQKNILHKMELARGNALLYTTYKHLHDEDMDKNEEYRVNSDIAKALEDENIPVRRVTGDQLFKEFNETPKQLLTEGRVLLTGEHPMTTPDGQLIVDPETQQPRYERTYAIADGLKDGKIKLPDSFVQYLQKYAPYAQTKIQNLETLPADHEVDARTFYRLHNAALEGMKSVQQGWAKPDAMEGADKKLYEKNTITGEMRP